MSRKVSKDYIQPNERTEVNPLKIESNLSSTTDAADQSQRTLSAAVFNKDQLASASSSSPEVEEEEVQVYCNPLTEVVQEQEVPSYLDFRQQTGYKPDRDLEDKVRKACERFSENVHICANEPSLALYRLTEHVRKALPPTVESRIQIQHLHQQLQGVYYDAEYGLETVKSMERASPHLRNVTELLKESLFLKQQIKHEQQRRVKKASETSGGGGPPSSMYQRLSAHLNSVDLPAQLDRLSGENLKELSRETKSRVETAFSTPSSSASAGSARQASVSSRSSQKTSQDEVGEPSNLDDPFVHP